MRRPILCLCLAGIVPLLASCGTFNAMITPDFDPEFHQLNGMSEINPSPRAIVGMWFDKTPAAMASILFSSNGKGMMRSNLEGMGEGTSEGGFVWKYDGEGWWSVHVPSAVQNGYETKTRFRLSQGKLLQHSTFSGPGTFISTGRVYVNADDAAAVAAEKGR